jgi:hypothetical protein
MEPHDDGPDRPAASGSSFRAADERPHRSDADGWWEGWQLDVAGDDGLGIAVLLACTSRVAWWWTHLLLPGRSGPVVVRDHEIALPRVGLEVRADGLWGELVCETPFEHWTYGLEAFGVALDDPAESLDDEIGERLPVGFDLEWEVDPSFGDVRANEDRLDGYAQHGVVHGALLLGRSRIDIDAAARRSHVWGVPRWDAPFSSYWLRGANASAGGPVEDPTDARELGRFLVPVRNRDGVGGVVTRTLRRSAAGNGWSTTYVPD